MLIKLDEAIAAILAAGYEGSQGEAVVEINDAVEALRALPVSDGVTDEMVERAARAMAANRGLDWDGKNNGTEYANHGYWLPCARAALEAALGPLPAPPTIE